MNEIFKKTVKEIVRVLASAFLAWLGIAGVEGCCAVGDGASSAMVNQFHTTKGN